ncbi:Pimeloyl-ACP methyl ester carboxylesterase [Seinonella peptonophila]|uniref:Pimeloyl-ACP methyl ester carboxylesterase n=1 Tax=Seinonella peptonophila TaxID=112248 RepID=A0A1M4X8F0_9BACL|nr:alpha/beta hydrolase [Seinonella peptonophila]SHE89754.1 Pimeloyl-ACP methyl ester carboxylesterase [Seinonella peptonophila]
MSNLITSVIFRKRNQRQNEKFLQISTPNGIDEEAFIQINEQDQWISIRGEDRNQPILFFVHGGPASSYSIFQPLLRSWEKYFTIVHWDQPGAGKTFGRNGIVDSERITFDRLVNDGIKVVEYLRERLGQQKMILIGSSVGSLIGILMASRRPDLFYAYVGTDQNSPDPNQIGYQLAKEAFIKSANQKGLQLLNRLGSNKKDWNQQDYDAFNKQLVKTIKDVPNMITDLILPSMLSSPKHTLRDIIDYFKGMNYSSAQLFEELMHFYDHHMIISFELPVFIFHGDTDIVTPTATAKEYFHTINAPHKEFVLIRQAGHLACFARPDQFLKELLSRVLPIVKSEIKAYNQFC